MYGELNVGEKSCWVATVVAWWWAGVRLKGLDHKEQEQRSFVAVLRPSGSQHWFRFDPSNGKNLSNSLVIKISKIVLSTIINACIHLFNCYFITMINDTCKL